MGGGSADIVIVRLETRKYDWDKLIQKWDNEIAADSNKIFDTLNINK